MGVTPEERAAGVRLHWLPPEECGGRQGVPDLVCNAEEVVIAIREAVAEEREAVATYLDEYHKNEAPVSRLAEEIRNGDHLKVGESEGAVGRSQGP